MKSAVKFDHRADNLRVASGVSKEATVKIAKALAIEDWNSPSQLLELIIKAAKNVNEVAFIVHAITRDIEGKKARGGDERDQQVTVEVKRTLN